jgi:hypothetical protein
MLTFTLGLVVMIEQMERNSEKNDHNIIISLFSTLEADKE